MRPTGNMAQILLESRFSSLPRIIPTFYASPHNSVRCDTQPKYPVPPLERLDLNQQEFQPGARNTNPQQKSRPRYLFSLSLRHLQPLTPTPPQSPHQSARHSPPPSARAPRRDNLETHWHQLSRGFQLHGSGPPMTPPRWPGLSPCGRCRS